jgi:hypothetical protein
MMKRKQHKLTFFSVLVFAPLAVSIVLQSSLRTATGASSSDCRSIASLSLPIATAIGAGGGGGCCSSGKNNHLLII